MQSLLKLRTYCYIISNVSAFNNVKIHEFIILEIEVMKLIINLAYTINDSQPKLKYNLQLLIKLRKQASPTKIPHIPKQLRKTLKPIQPLPIKNKQLHLNILMPLLSCSLIDQMNKFAK